MSHCKIFSFISKCKAKTYLLQVKATFISRYSPIKALKIFRESQTELVELHINV